MKFASASFQKVAASRGSLTERLCSKLPGYPGTDITLRGMLTFYGMSPLNQPCLTAESPVRIDEEPDRISHVVFMNCQNTDELLLQEW